MVEIASSDYDVTMESLTEDDATMESSTESIGPQYQKRIGVEKLLPYAQELDDESNALLAEIKGNLGRAVMLRQLYPGCLLWTYKLRRFLIAYGYKFNKEDHIVFVKLMYELVTIPGLEPYLINFFGSTLTKLLNKPELISPDELELPWEPLYKLVRRLLHLGRSAHGIRHFSSSYAQYRGLMRNLVFRVKLHFPVTATQEILDELRPRLCPLNRDTMTKTVELLEWFLPVRLFPKDHHLGYKLWFVEFMSLWEVCRNAPEWEQKMMWLVAKLALHNIGYIDWEPYVPVMFTRFIRYLNLPVYYKQTYGYQSQEFEALSVTMWIVSTLGNGSSTQLHLEKFLKTIETYFHQANSGPWAMKLKQILDKLTLFFILRIHKERFGKRTWVLPTPDSHKLTDADIDAFVEAVRPVAMTAMFSNIGVNEACTALQHLAMIRPNLVIPDVIERMYSTLDSLTEPHKMTAAILGMTAVARPMVQGSRNVNQGYTYAEGPSHVVPLLFSLLPGIDANDTQKFFITCRLITIYAALLPFVDTSRCSVPMDEDEALVNESTSRFEDFVLQFFDRIFSLIESSTLEFLTDDNRAARGGKSVLETMAEETVMNVCSPLLLQTSDTIFLAALHKLRTFVTDRIFETTVSGQLVAAVCRSFARVNGNATLRSLMPVLSEMILDMIGDGDEILNEENLDHRLLYAMLLLSSIVKTQGNNLLPYVHTMTKIFDKMLHLKSREGSQLASTILKSVFTSFSSVANTRVTTNGRDYNDPEYPYFKDWGLGSDIYDFKLDWYVPGEKEVATLQTLFSRYAPPEITKIQQHAAKKISLTREELLTSLNIINSILEGAEDFYPLSADTPIVTDPQISAWTSFLPTLGLHGEIRMPDGGNVRNHLSKVMSELQEMMLNNSEDDTKSLFVLVQIWRTFLLGKNRMYDTFEFRCENFKMATGMLKDRLVNKKGHLGGICIMRCAEIHHDRRAQSRYYAFTEAHKSMMLELFKLATSLYADVRLKAQTVLISAFRYFPYSYIVVVPKLLEILATDPEENHEAHKGLLYLLLGNRSEALMTVRDWSILRALWPAILLSKPSEKLSVIRLKETLVQTVYRHFSTIGITYDIPDRCVVAATALWHNSPRPHVSQPRDDEIRQGREELEKLGETNAQLYDGLLNELLHSVLEKNPHWRHRSMAMSFITNLVHPDRSYPPKVVRYFVNALVHESLGERKIAAKTVVSMLTQQKRKHVKIKVDPAEYRPQSQSPLTEANKWCPGIRPDNMWLQYNYETRPLTVDQWNESRYVHDPDTGYYTWPKKLEVYAPSSQQPSLDTSTRLLSEHESEIDRFFADPQNIMKLVKYNSLEERKGKDRFNTMRAQLFKGLFRNHGIVHLKHFLPHLRTLVADSHESSQRCAAEIVAGLIKGTKHWPFEMVTELWRELTPIVRTILSNLTAETMVDWIICFHEAAERRDPNRQHWLLESLMEEPPLGDSTTSSVECFRMRLLQTVLRLHSWRVIELKKRLVSRVEERLLANPFHNVRVRLGGILATVYAQDIEFPCSSNDRFAPRARDLLEKIMPRLRQLGDPSATVLVRGDNDTNLLSRVTDVKLESTAASQDSTHHEQNLRTFRTICKWTMTSAWELVHGIAPEFYELLPIACQLENSDADEELSRTCSLTLAVLAQNLTLPRDMEVALRAVKNISRSASWSSRTTCLRFMEILVFYNMGIVVSRQNWVNDVRTIVLQMLEDERLEVREKAAQVLEGLVHCTFIEDQESLLDEFKLKSKRRIKKRDDIRLRHAGVLGLCAFIRAHPYDVPKYVPSVFEHLGIHLNDPQPIPTTIRKTLGDFKRTHYDGWAGHALRFTAEQLAILQDLTAPPSYYA